MPMIWAKVVLKLQFWQMQQNSVLVIIVIKMVLTCTTTCTSCFCVHHHHYHGHDQDHHCVPYFKTCTMSMLWFSSSLSSIFRTFTKICGAQLILILIIIVFQFSLPVLYAVVQSPVKLWVSSSWGSSIPRSTSKGIWSS